MHRAPTQWGRSRTRGANMPPFTCRVLLRNGHLPRRARDKPTTGGKMMMPFPLACTFCFTGSPTGRWRGLRVTGWMCSTSTRGILSSRSRCRRCSWRRWSPHRTSQGQVRRNAFLLASPPPPTTFCLNFRNSLERLWENDDLPRQARDKRQETFKTRAVVGGVSA